MADLITNLFAGFREIHQGNVRVNGFHGTLEPGPVTSKKVKRKYARGKVESGRQAVPIPDVEFISIEEFEGGQSDG